VNNRPIFRWFLTRNVILYFLLAGASFLLVSRKEITTTTLDFLKDVPGYIMAYANGVEGFDATQVRAALRYYKYFAKLYPKSAEALNAIGYCYYTLGSYQRAALYFERAIAADPEFFGIYMNLGVTYYKLKDYAKAFAIIRLTNELRLPEFKSIANAEFPVKKTIIEQNPDPEKRLTVAVKKSSEYAYLYLMSCLLKMNNYQAVLTIFPSALRVSEEYSAWFYCLAGIALYELKDYQKAFELFTKTLEFQPDHYPAIQYLHESAEKAGAVNLPQSLKTRIAEYGQKQTQLKDWERQLPDWLFFYPPIRVIGEHGKEWESRYKQ
jgi:tetratricopeptide (TPR) repeat protein